MSLFFNRWTLLVLRDCIFLSSLDAFLRLYVCSSTLVGEDLFCAPLEHIETDYLARAQGIGHEACSLRLTASDGLQQVMDFDMVMPASFLPRRDKYEQNYSAHFAAQGLAEPTTGRPIWDLGQNAIRGVSKSKYSPTMLPRSTLWSSSLKRPATVEEHFLHQGIVLGRIDAPLYCIEMHCCRRALEFLIICESFTARKCNCWFFHNSTVFKSVFKQTSGGPSSRRNTRSGSTTTLQPTGCSRNWQAMGST